MHFIQNEGQLDSHVRYYMRQGRETAYFTDEGAYFTLDRLEEDADMPAMHGEDEDRGSDR
jgi:hypothetical protein